MVPEDGGISNVASRDRLHPDSGSPPGIELGLGRGAPLLNANMIGVYKDRFSQLSVISIGGSTCCQDHSPVVLGSGAEYRIFVRPYKSFRIQKTSLGCPATTEEFHRFR